MFVEMADNNDVTITKPKIHKNMNLLAFLADNTGLVTFANILPNGLNISSCLLQTDLKSKITIYTFAKKITNDIKTPI